MTTASAAPAKERLFTTNFIVACLITFASFLSVNFLLATLPPYVQGLGGVEGDVGLAAGVFSISALLVRPFAGLGSDRLGSKRLIVVGCLFLFITPDLLGGIPAQAFAGA